MIQAGKRNETGLVEVRGWLQFYVGCQGVASLARSHLCTGWKEVRNKPCRNLGQEGRASTKGYRQEHA